MGNGFVIDISEIKPTAGGRSRFETAGEFETPDFRADVRAAGSALNMGRGMFAVSCTITGCFTVPCARCLSPVTLDYDTEIDFRFTSGESVDEALCATGDTLDFTQAVAGAIRADIPIRVVCKEDCSGLCPVCGNNLNERVCGCEKELLNPVMLKNIDI